MDGPMEGKEHMSSGWKTDGNSGSFSEENKYLNIEIVEPSYEIINGIDGEKILKTIELATRTCYKSENNITNDSHIKMVEKLMDLNHMSQIEHGGCITVKFVCNRGFSHELVRHRLASFSQESSRYCNYSKNKFGNKVSVIKPWWATEGKETQYELWRESMNKSAEIYFRLLNMDLRTDAARGVLPIDLKTEIVISCNPREWLHIFRLRRSKEAHPDMRRLMNPLLKEFRSKIPIIYDGLKLYDVVTKEEIKDD